MISEATIIALAALLMSVIVGTYNIIRGNKQDGNQQSKDAADTRQLLTEIKTSQEFMSNDTKDMKADLRSFQRDLQEIRTTAAMALASANKANERIDNLEKGGAHE